MLSVTAQTFQNRVVEMQQQQQQQQQQQRQQQQQQQQPSELQRIVAEVASLRSEMERVQRAAAAAAAPQPAAATDPASSIREITQAFTLSLREIIASVRAPASQSAGQCRVM